MPYKPFKTFCSSEKNKLISNFKILEKEFNRLGYDIVLHAGTLLGALRGGFLIPNDNDIDFIILHKSQSMKQVRQEIIDIYNYFYHKARLCKDTHLIGHQHFYVDDMHFDGWNCWIDENEEAFITFDVYGELKRTDIYPLKKILIEGTEFNAINNPQKLCKIMYGVNWQIPSDTKHVIPSKQVLSFFNGWKYSYPNRVYTQKEILLNLKDLLGINGIECWLMAGTLLGTIRENNFLTCDPNDIDLGLDIKNYWKVREILDKSDFNYKYIWNKEIAIYKGNNVHPHIDLFFHNYDDINFYCYSYKPNRISSIWNEEWRMFIPKEILTPLKNINFLGTNFKIPAKTEAYLELLYGKNWKTPDPTWKCSHYPNADTNYSSISAIVTTFNRNDSLEKLVSSFCTLYPEIPLIVGNQNKDEIVINQPNVTVIQLPEDCGLSYARNELVKHVKTEFTLILEDDFIITKNTDIYKLLEIFSADRNIGIVGGRLWQSGAVKSYEKFLFILNITLLSIEWSKLVENKTITEHKINRTSYGICDIIFNFFLAKTDILKKYPWDSGHKIHSEHIDFFLNLKLNTDVKVAFVPTVLVEHQHPIQSEEYKKLRERMYYNLIYTKYGIEKGFTLGERAIINYKENRRENV